MADKKRRTGTDLHKIDRSERSKSGPPRIPPCSAVTVPGFPPFLEGRTCQGEPAQRTRIQNVLPLGYLVLATILGVCLAVVALVGCAAAVLRVLDRPPTRFAERQQEVHVSPRAEVPPAPLLSSSNVASLEGTSLAKDTPLAAPSPPPHIDAAPVAPSPAPSRPSSAGSPSSHRSGHVLVGRGTLRPRAASDPSPAEAGEPPPEPTGSGTVEVTPTPYGVLFVDGRRHGYTPITLQLPAGQHRLRVDREAYVSEERILAVAPDGMTRWTPHLRPE